MSCLGLKALRWPEIVWGNPVVHSGVHAYDAIGQASIAQASGCNSKPKPETL